MKIRFTDNDVMEIHAETDVEAMALKYWDAEFAKHGEKLLEVVTDVPYRLPAPADD
ncbi:hypothetical protein KLER11_gp75 [Pararheinheimera phage vB_PsoM_KLER1-1]|nr:hypothetical protein KLER11_gp75 [Pararheinheimera phage vB_PsoM_KLER1-1]